ncbi:nicotinamide N-methyltransferase-like [Hyla sarda]|uniref:nicotinamide N-methyltransferase-like n=1 Tax=Hyla sarda TaxID=327740 RepID=UPI0024C31016|nr:nicotinamide N-methyltransferase-like [Hyla sarda]
MPRSSSKDHVDPSFQSDLSVLIKIDLLKAMDSDISIISPVVVVCEMSLIFTDAGILGINRNLCREKMETIKQKLEDVDALNNRTFLQTYFSTDNKTSFVDETLKFLIKSLHNILAAGNFKGQTAYDLSVGSIIHQLFALCEYYPEITILKLNEALITEVTKWMNSDTDAFNWGHACNFLKELVGTGDQERKLKSSIKKIMTFGLPIDTLTDPVVLQPADCLVTAWLLDVTCQNQNEYIKKFQKLAKLLKPGGLLIYIGCLNATYYTIGQERQCVFTYDESFLRKNLTNEGFKIETCEVLDSKIQSDLTDYKQFIVLTAVKKAA